MSARGTWNTAVRATGFCTLLVLAFHATSGLALDHDPGLGRYGGCLQFLDLPFLQPDLTSADLPPPAAAGALAEEALPSAASALPSAHTSRGPPA